MCLGQDLKQFPFWNYFLVVSCEEFVVAVNPFSLSYHLLFPFVHCFDLNIIDLCFLKGGVASLFFLSRNV